MAASKKRAGKKAASNVSQLPARRSSVPQETSPQTLLHTQESRANFLPIPTPDILVEYEELIPDAAERFLRVYELEVEHRRDLERRDQADDSRIATAVAIVTVLAPVLAFGIAIFFAYIAWQIALSGHPGAAGVIAALDIAAIVYGVQRNRRAQSPPRD